MDFLCLMAFGILTIFGSTLGTNFSNMLTLAPASDEISHFVNSSFIVFCRSKYKDIRLHWYSPMGAIIINNKGRVHIEEKPGQLALVFEHIAHSDRGTWACRTVGDEVYQKSFELLVNLRITFVNFQMIQYAKENRDATIYCEVRGEPEPAISWYRNGDLIKFPSAKYKQLSDGLYIRSVTQLDDGEYTCRAFQISPTITDVQERTFYLRIQHKPIWSDSEPPNTYFAYIGGFVNMSCDAKAEPPPSFTWVFENKAISSLTNSDYRIFRDDYKSVLQVYVRNDTYFGDYKCKVANALGTLEWAIQLKKGQKPISPYAFQSRRIYSNGFELDIRCLIYADVPENMRLTGYRVEYMTENDFKYAAGNWSFAEKQDFTFKRGSRFVVQGLEGNTTYYLRAASRNLAGLSDWTKIEKLTTSPSGAQMISRSNTLASILLCSGLVVKYLNMF